MKKLSKQQRNPPEDDLVDEEKFTAEKKIDYKIYGNEMGIGESKVDSSDVWRAIETGVRDQREWQHTKN